MKFGRPPVVDCPQPDGREIEPRHVVQFMPAVKGPSDEPPRRAETAGSNSQQEKTS